MDRDSTPCCDRPGVDVADVLYGFADEDKGEECVLIDNQGDTVLLTMNLVQLLVWQNRHFPNQNMLFSLSL